jgi:hypothetical protein
MSGDAAPAFDAPDPNLVANLKLEVRAAYRPGRWMWQLVDARDGTVLERAFEFDDPNDAQRSGLARLAELTPSLPGAKGVGRSSPTQETGSSSCRARKRRCTRTYAGYSPTAAVST